jgi:hypothetical protein
VISFHCGAEWTGSRSSTSCSPSGWSGCFGKSD